jgi:hypothetical protein
MRKTEICPICHITVAPYAPDRKELPTGVYHDRCTRQLPINGHEHLQLVRREVIH